MLGRGCGGAAVANSVGLEGECGGGEARDLGADGKEYGGAGVKVVGCGDGCEESSQVHPVRAGPAFKNPRPGFLSGVGPGTCCEGRA